MDIEKLKEELRRHEGLRLSRYKCSAGHWTIGYGHLMTPEITFQEPISIETVEELFKCDIGIAIDTARQWLGKTFDELDDIRQRVVVNMCFNLGYRIFRFIRLRGALQEGDYVNAAIEMRTSRWHAQVGQRAIELESMMREYTDEYTAGNS